MGASPSYYQPAELKNVHNNFDIKICGYDLGNGTMMPTKCPNNSLNSTNKTAHLISSLKMPNIPINKCIPLNFNTGVEINKNINNKPHFHHRKDIKVSEFNVSTCSHIYDYNKGIRPPNDLLVVKNFYELNKKSLHSLDNIMKGKGESVDVIKPVIKPFINPVINPAIKQPTIKIKQPII